MTRLRHAIDAAAVALAEAGVGSPRTDAELLAAHAAGTDRGRLAFADIGPEFRRTLRRARRPAREAGAAATPHRYRGVRPGDRARRARRVHPAAGDGVAAGMGCGARVVAAVRSSSTCAPAPARWRSRCRRTGPTPASSPSTTPRTRSPTPDATPPERRSNSIQADVTAPGLLAELDGQVDLVVANPPYIPDGAALEPEVAEHDPPHALFGGPDGMAVIDRIVELAARLLRDGGRCARRTRRHHIGAHRRSVHPHRAIRRRHRPTRPDRPAPVRHRGT